MLDDTEDLHLFALGGGIDASAHVHAHDARILRLGADAHDVCGQQALGEWLAVGQVAVAYHHDALDRARSSGNLAQAVAGQRQGA
jgi:hypothetical protein